jgi:uncharacterized membrane protein
VLSRTLEVNPPITKLEVNVIDIVVSFVGLIVGEAVVGAKVGRGVGATLGVPVVGIDVGTGVGAIDGSDEGL